MNSLYHTERGSKIRIDDELKTEYSTDCTDFSGQTRKGGGGMTDAPVLYIIVPCYNEEKVLPITAGLFLDKLTELIKTGRIDDSSRILFVNDGSRDSTWDIIRGLAERDPHYTGISQSRNRGHQSTVLAGLMEAKELCDITISIDCDGQDDMNAMNEMVEEYRNGCDIVYGVRNSRESDTPFKRNTAQSFYRLMSRMGAEVVYNHADYRLLSARVLKELANYKEVNLFLRGMIPLIGFKSTCVYYERHERIAGESHYPLRKMIGLAADGITSLSISPLRMILKLGAVISFVSVIGLICILIMAIAGNAASAIVCATLLLCLIGGLQLLCMGVLGEYVGKTFMEVKHRPRYIISERTDESRQKEHDRIK